MGIWIETINDWQPNSLQLKVILPSLLETIVNDGLVE
jgi:hypothetical protein